MSNDDVAWLVRVDNSRDPVLQVNAPDWYAARAKAAELLGVDNGRIFVSRKTYLFQH